MEFGDLRPVTAGSVSPHVTIDRCKIGSVGETTREKQQLILQYTNLPSIVRIVRCAPNSMS